MNNVDNQYLSVLEDIILNGTWKDTRSGKVKTLFCKTMRFDLKEGLPLLTTKRVFYKGIIHELLWFLRGDTNIKYLVENNVNIWNDDAYRFYKTKYNNNLSFGDFIDKVKNGERIDKYTYGDLGPIYGKQWRNFGVSGVDQINSIIEKLKHSPDDRRMMCVAFNPDVVDDVALPPCHISFQFFTKKLSLYERCEWVRLKHNKIISINDHKEFERLGYDVPERELSCSFTMRSNDFCCGNPFNIAQYAILTEMIAHVCNMSVGELVYFGNDVHVYENHIDLAKIQLKRSGCDTLPRLLFNRNINSIDDFVFTDFNITNYNPDEAIKYPLSVGL